MRLTPRFIYIHDHVQINDFARIEGIERYNNDKFDPHIIFHSNVSIQQGIHLTCAKRVEIGKNTAIAANVSITDINHPYHDINIPVEQQDIEVDEVIIGEACKIYNNVVILPGVKLGNHSIIAANSVVVKGIYDDYIVLGGIPAKIIKKYDFETKKWIKG